MRTVEGAGPYNIFGRAMLAPTKIARTAGDSSLRFGMTNNKNTSPCTREVYTKTY